MKKFVFCCCYLLVFNFVILAQEKGKFNLPIQNIVYSGFRNPIIIYDFVKGDTLVCSDSSQIIKRKVSGEYFIIPGRNTDELNLFVKNNKGKVKSEIKLKVVNFSIPRATVMGVSEGVISGSELAKAKSINVKMPCVDGLVEIEVLSFTISIIGNNSDYIKVKGRNFNQQVKSKFANLERGTRVFFEDIIVKMPNGERKKIVSVVLKIR